MSLGEPQSLPQSLNDLSEWVLQAFRLWYAPDSDGHPLALLLACQQLYLAGNLTRRQAGNQLLRQQLDVLQQIDRDASVILQQRFIEDLPAHIVANRINLAEGSVFRKQQQGIQRIAELLRQQEWQLRSNQRNAMLMRLEPPTYSQLFGATTSIQQLSQTLLAPHAPWIIAIEGLGGIGKTATADALTRQLIATHSWDDLAWVTARQLVMNLGGGVKQVEKPALTVEALVESLCAQLLPDLSAQSGISFDGRLRALTQRLKQARHLIVIDNLETMLDVESLLATLRTWVNPSKVLLTTRQRLLDEADIFHHSLPELGEADALQLLRLEAQTRNLPDVIDASDADLLPIYQSVGGNPLALRLVVGQLHIHPLDQVLSDLHHATGEPILNLYRYIYRRAWELLDEPSRIALVSMLLTTERGKSLEELNELTRNQLSAEQLRHGLNQLVMLSLVDSRGDLHQRRYTIHSLTRTFLHDDVMKW